MATSLIHSTIATQKFHSNHDNVSCARSILSSNTEALQANIDVTHSCSNHMAGRQKNSQQKATDNAKQGQGHKTSNNSMFNEVSLLEKLYYSPSQQVLGALTQFLSEDYLMRVLNEDVDSDDSIELDSSSNPGGYKFTNSDTSSNSAYSNNKLKSDSSKGSSNSTPVNRQGNNSRVSTNVTASVYSERKRKNESENVNVSQIKRECLSPPKKEQSNTNTSKHQGYTISPVSNQDLLKTYLDQAAIKTEKSDAYIHHTGPVLNKGQRKLVPLQNISGYGQKLNEIPRYMEDRMSHMAGLASHVPRPVVGSYNIASILGTADNGSCGHQSSYTDTPLDLSVKSSHSYHVASLSSVLNHVVAPSAVHPGVIRPTPINPGHPTHQHTSMSLVHHHSGDLTHINNNNTQMANTEISAHDIGKKTTLKSSTAVVAPSTLSTTHTPVAISHTESNTTTKKQIINDIANSNAPSANQLVPPVNHSISMSISEQKALQRKIASIVPKKRHLVEAESCNSKPLKKRIVDNLASPEHTMQTDGNKSASAQEQALDFSQNVSSNQQTTKTPSQGMSPCKSTARLKGHQQQHKSVQYSQRERSTTPEDVNLHDFASDIIDRVYSDTGSSNECTSPPTLHHQEDSNSNEANSSIDQRTLARFSPTGSDLENLQSASEQLSPSSTHSGTPDNTVKVSKNQKSRQNLRKRNPRRSNKSASQSNTARQSKNVAVEKNVNTESKLFSITDIITNMIEVEYSNSNDGSSTGSAKLTLKQEMLSSDDEDSGVIHSMKQPPRTRSQPQPRITLPNPAIYHDSDYDSESDSFSDPDYHPHHGANQNGNRFFKSGRMTVRTLSDNDLSSLCSVKESKQQETFHGSLKGEIFNDEEEDQADDNCKRLKKWEREVRLKHGKAHICNHGKCDKSFSSYKFLQSHRYSYHQCSDCKKHFSIRPSLMAHMKFHNRGRFLCELCGESFHFNLTYQKHKLGHAEETPYACDLCGMSYPTMVKLSQHKTLEEKQQKYICSICTKSFCLSKELANHMNAKHRCLRFKCRRCRSSYQEMYQLKRHEQLKHQVPAVFSCDVCHAAYPTWSAYSQCMRSHTGNHRFLCTKCSATCNSFDQLRIHMNSHIPHV